VFVDDLDRPEPTSEALHHLLRVLRLRPGELVAVSDGLGRWRPCRFTGESPSVGFDPDGDVVVCPRPDPPVTVAFVPVKGSRTEWVVQKLTECGVDGIAILRSTRAVVRWDDARAARSLERLDRVAREAAAQSRRPWLPQVTGVYSLEGLSKRLSPVRPAIAHPGGGPLDGGVTAVAIGPEGGWDDDELLSDLRQVGLGAGTLRAETAAVSAGVLLCALRDGLVAEVPTPRYR
jgi:16S rRNA (uracil1498-N3)-methyltransferase